MMIFTVNSSKEKPKLIINQRPAHTKIASAGPVTMDYLEYALPQLTVCRLPIAAAAVHDSCWWIFSCLLLFFPNIKAMVCNVYLSQQLF